MHFLVLIFTMQKMNGAKSYGFPCLVVGQDGYKNPWRSKHLAKLGKINSNHNFFRHNDTCLTATWSVNLTEYYSVSSSTHPIKQQVISVSEWYVVLFVACTYYI